MNITKVYFDKATEKEKEKSKKLVGFADIVIDYSFVIHDIMLFNGEKGEYILFPQNYNGKYIAFPVTNEARLQILYAILDKKAELEAKELMEGR